MQVWQTKAKTDRTEVIIIIIFIKRIKDICLLQH
jgi:hypothetical protein